jgi:NAD(P)H-quinone oxidoreductase subunit 5
LTAIFASLVMLTQTSIKVSLAYSTVAQMGFMFLECGLGAFSAALLHIVAHSLYKAHAFLSSGSVIDLFRASWTPSPGGQPHPGRLVLALVAVLGATFAISAAFGATLVEKPGVFALGAIMLMGLTVLLANAIDEKPSLYVIARTTVVAALVAVVYFALQAAAEIAVDGSIPPVLPSRGPANLFIAVFFVAAFAGVVLLQNQLARQNKKPFWQALYVHLANGFYVNTLANRLAVALWPAQKTSPEHSPIKA